MFKVKRVRGKGHGVVANDDIPAGNVVFTEEALVIGPASPLACIECLTVDEEDCKCKNCGFKLCQSCLSINSIYFHWHTNLECSLLYNLNKDPKAFFNLIFPMRFVAKWQKNKERFDKFMKLENHLEERLQQERKVKQSLLLMAKLLTDFYPDLHLNEAKVVVAVLLTNSFEMKIGQICGRAFYPVISRFNHSCLPNLSHVNLFNIGEPDPSQSPNRPRFFLRLISQLPISKGQELSIRYLSPLESFVHRQRTFLREWFFTCSCLRCRDPTEFGTYMSAVKCQKCFQGFVIPIRRDVEDEETEKLTQDLKSRFPHHFKCSNCENESIEESFSSMEDNIRGLMLFEKPGLKQVEKLLVEIKHEFHDHHCIIIMLKENAILKIAQNFDDLLAQETFTRQILEFIEAVEPGLTWKKHQLMAKLKGIILGQAKIKSEQPCDVQFLRKSLTEIQSLTTALESSKIFS